MSGMPLKSQWSCSGFELTALAGAIDSAYQLEAGARKLLRFQVYDSFNRAFASSDRLLVRIEGRFSVIDGDDLTQPLVGSRKRLQHQRPVFWQDFEAGAFQDLLRDCLKLRAAIPLTEASLEVRQFQIRNQDGKIVLRLTLRTIRSENKPVYESLLANPLVGYEEQAGEIARSISASSDFSDEPDRMVGCLQSVIADPRQASSAKSIVPIRPEDSVHTAVTRIAGTMLDVARSCESGLIDDIDTEFLHDYRVAIRKLRSVILLVKGAYPADETRRLKAEFGDHARATNHLRDLDVYLLKEANFRSRIPDSLRPGLDRLFADFRAERGKAVTKLRRRIRSKRYLASVASRKKWFEQETPATGKRADQAIGKVVVKEIRKHHRHVRKLGMALKDETPDKDVHELRIECKRLRYLLELFAPLFQPRKLKKILKRLKSLQTVLGDFNDFSMQSIAMESYLNQAQRLDKHSAAAVGALIAVLHGDQLKARAGIATRFKDFSDDKMERRFKALFSDIRSHLT